MLKRIMTAFALTVMLLACATPSQRSSKSPEELGKPPKILGHYASEKVAPGQSWKVHLRAQDEDGDMDHIVAMLYTPGSGFSQTSKTQLKEQDQARFAGYLYLNTPANINRFGAYPRMTLTIYLRDEQGNRSDKVELPLSFDNSAKQEVPAEWRDAAGNRLGALMIDFGAPGLFETPGRDF